MPRYSYLRRIDFNFVEEYIVKMASGDFLSNILYTSIIILISTIFDISTTSYIMFVRTLLLVQFTEFVVLAGELVEH